MKKLCVVKSSDGNWYRCTIIKHEDDILTVRYIDYGNCEYVSINDVKELEIQFCGINALAIQVYLPLGPLSDAEDNQLLMNEVKSLTYSYMLDGQILDYYLDQWIVEISFNQRLLVDVLSVDKKVCESLTIEQVKKIIENDMLEEDVKSIDEIQKEMNNTESTNVQSAPPTTSTTTTTTTTTNNVPNSIKCYVTHTNGPDRFYVTLTDHEDDIEKLQENIQIVATSLPQLEDFTVGNQCIALYTADELWYRGVIVDSDSEITSIQFYDYGNTDTITNNSMIKSMNEAFADIPPYAIACFLPLDIKGGGTEWPDEACNMFRDLVQDVDSFEVLSKGEQQSVVKLYADDQDIMQKLIQAEHAVATNFIKSQEKCYISHINSISDFYIQMDCDTKALETIADFLSCEENFPVLTTFEKNKICIAQYDEDELWYRAKILRHSDTDGTDVFFLDYGNTSTSKHLRELSPEIAQLPTLSRRCTLRMPKQIQYWSEGAEVLFKETSDMGATIFIVQLVVPGAKQSIVELTFADNEQNISGNLAELCEINVMAVSMVDEVVSELVAIEYPTMVAYICLYYKPNDFYVQEESCTKDLENMVELLTSADESFTVLHDAKVGDLCAAKYELDDLYYRAKVLAIGKNSKLI